MHENELSNLSPSLIVQSVFGDGLSSTNEGGFERFQLPIPKKADYQFCVDYREAEPQVGAKLLAAPDLYFWYLPFDRYASGNVNEINDALKAVLRKIACHKTRIIQKKGILMQSFVCDYFDDGWKKVDGISAFRFSNFRFPATQQRRSVYYSAPLLESK